MKTQSYKLLTALILISLLAACTPPPAVQEYEGLSKFTTIAYGGQSITYQVDCENCTASIITDTTCTEYDDDKTIVIKDSVLETNWDFVYEDAAGIYTFVAGSHDYLGGGCSNSAELIVIMEEGGIITRID